MSDNEGMSMTPWGRRTHLYAAAVLCNQAEDALVEAEHEAEAAGSEAMSRIADIEDTIAAMNTRLWDEADEARREGIKEETNHG